MKLVRHAALAVFASLALIALVGSTSTALAQSSMDAPTGVGRLQKVSPDLEPTAPTTSFELQTFAALAASLPADCLPGWASISPFVNAHAVRPAVLPGERRGASNFAVNRRPCTPGDVGGVQPAAWWQPQHDIER